MKQNLLFQFVLGLASTLSVLPGPLFAMEYTSNGSSQTAWRVSTLSLRELAANGAPIVIPLETRETNGQGPNRQKESAATVRRNSQSQNGAWDSRNTVIDGRESHAEQLRHQNVMIREFKTLHLSTAQWAQIEAFEKAFHEKPRSAPPTHAQLMIHNKRMMSVLTPAQRRQFGIDMAKRWKHTGVLHPTRTNLVKSSL